MDWRLFKVSHILAPLFFVFDLMNVLKLPNNHETLLE